MGKPVKQLQRETTSKEFVMWKAVFEEEANWFDPLFYYLAAIRAEIIRVNVKDPKSILTEDYLLEFGTKEDVEDDRQRKTLADDQGMRRYRVSSSKAAWFAATGYSPQRVN